MRRYIEGFFMMFAFRREGLRGVRSWTSDSRKHHWLSITFFLEDHTLNSTFFFWKITQSFPFCFLEDHALISNLFLEDLTSVSSFFKAVKSLSSIANLSSGDSSFGLMKSEMV
jgi:hypothetical protein